MITFIPPYSLTNSIPEVWLSAAGGPNWGGCDVWASSDGSSYKFIGKIMGGARQGVLTAGLSSGDSLAVQLDDTTKQLLSATPADAANGVTLCYVGGELISYTAATLTGAGAYTLTGLTRGLHGTPVSSHASGSAFLRLDDAVFQYAFPSALLGTTIYFKLASFNIFGSATEPLDVVNAVALLLSPPAPGTVTNLTQSVNLNQVKLSWDPIATVLPLDYYEVSSGSVARSNIVTKTKTTFATVSEITTGTKTYWVTAIDSSGQPGTPHQVTATISEVPQVRYTTLMSGQTLSGHTVVVFNSSFNLIAANSSLTSNAGSIIGITVQSAVSGDTVQVAVDGETITEPSWSWSPNQPLYFNTEGTLTTTRPTSGFIQQVATAVSATTILVRATTPIILV